MTLLKVFTETANFLSLHLLLQFPLQVLYFNEAEGARNVTTTIRMQVYSRTDERLSNHRACFQKVYNQI